MPDTTRNRFNFRPKDIGNVRALSCECTAPGAVHWQRQLRTQSPCGIMDGLEQSPDRDTLPSAKILAQFGNQSLKFRQYNVDRDTIVRFCHTSRHITAGRSHPEADKLPRRRHPTHDRQQGVKKQLPVTGSRVLYKGLAFIELGIRKVADL